MKCLVCGRMFHWCTNCGWDAGLHAMSKGYCSDECLINERGEFTRLVQESSANSSYLWVGEDHHLCREQVAQLVVRLQHWLDTGRLAVDRDAEQIIGSE